MHRGRGIMAVTTLKNGAGEGLVAMWRSRQLAWGADGQTPRPPSAVVAFKGGYAAVFPAEPDADTMDNDWGLGFAA
jgi:hypothetical protein